MFENCFFLIDNFFIDVYTVIQTLVLKTDLKKVKTVKLKLKADDGHLNIKSQSIVKWLNKDLSSEVIIGDKRHFDEAKAVSSYVF